jgi:toxin ParE1/3/4
MPSGRKLRLSVEAQDDLRDLLQYSLQRWGWQQRDAYKSKIQRRLRDLATYPDLGRARDEYFPGCRSLPVEQHVVYYPVTETEILVTRILHAKRDAGGLIKEPRP